MCRLRRFISSSGSKKSRRTKGEAASRRREERETTNSLVGEASDMANKPPFTYMQAAELLKLGAQSVVIVDVRDEEREYDGHIAGSYHYPSVSFHEKVPDLLNDIKGRDTVVFHCAMSQIRGPTCARALAAHLNKSTCATPDARRPKVVVLERGFNGWSAAGRPVCSCPDARCTHVL